MTSACDRITHSPDVLGGRATIRGLRISVAHVVNLVANGMTLEQVIIDLPDLDLEDVRQALAYAAALAKDELHPLRAQNMRFLADAAISPETFAFLAGLGHDVVHVRALGMQRASDREIIDRARSDEPVVLTFDLDYGDILALDVLDRPSVVLLRLFDERPDAVNGRVTSATAEQQAASASGALVLVEDSRYRVRKLPIRPD